MIPAPGEWWARPGHVPQFEILIAGDVQLPGQQAPVPSVAYRISGQGIVYIRPLADFLKRFHPVRSSPDGKS